MWRWRYYRAPPRTLAHPLARPPDRQLSTSPSRLVTPSTAGEVDLARQRIRRHAGSHDYTSSPCGAGRARSPGCPDSRRCHQPDRAARLRRRPLRHPQPRRGRALARPRPADDQHTHWGTVNPRSSVACHLRGESEDRCARRRQRACSRQVLQGSTMSGCMSRFRTAVDHAQSTVCASIRLETET